LIGQDAVAAALKSGKTKQEGKERVAAARGNGSAPRTNVSSSRDTSDVERRLEGIEL
jgi:hypothetical protein